MIKLILSLTLIISQPIFAQSSNDPVDFCLKNTQMALSLCKKAQAGFEYCLKNTEMMPRLCLDAKVGFEYCVTHTQMMPRLCRNAGASFKACYELGRAPNSCLE